MSGLSLYGSYDRDTIRSFFDPEAPYTRGAGQWGIAGIIPLKKSPGDFVFIVTLGKREGNHQFDEGISEDGILRWQSQPEQTLRSSTVRALINHNDETNHVHLFLRPRASRAGRTLPYTYLGRLKYLSHDEERERPVHFAWQLIDWPIPPHLLEDVGIPIAPEGAATTSDSPAPSGLLVQEDPPLGREERGETTRSFRARKMRYSSDEMNRALGAKGERLVLERERRVLREAGKTELADKVEHVSLIHGDGLGYDILSFFIDGREKFIEVKTTTGGKGSDFYVSPNEVAFSKSRSESFVLARVFEYDHVLDCGRFYVLGGDIEDHCALVVTQHRASLKLRTKS